MSAQPWPVATTVLTDVLTAIPSRFCRPCSATSTPRVAGTATGAKAVKTVNAGAVV
ncbi:hypothetical protein [Streptomyces sp. NPDC002671]